MAVLYNRQFSIVEGVVLNILNDIIKQFEKWTQELSP